MQIKLKWLPRAIALLDDIYEYYSEKSERSAIPYGVYLDQGWTDGVNQLEVFFDN